MMRVIVSLNASPSLANPLNRSIAPFVNCASDIPDRSTAGPTSLMIAESPPSAIIIASKPRATSPPFFPLGSFGSKPSAFRSTSPKSSAVTRSCSVSSMRPLTRLLNFLPALPPFHFLSTISRPVASRSVNAWSSCVPIANGSVFIINTVASTTRINISFIIVASTSCSARSFFPFMILPPTLTIAAPTCVPGTEGSIAEPIALRSNGAMDAESFALGVGSNIPPIIPPK